MGNSIHSARVFKKDPGFMPVEYRFIVLLQTPGGEYFWRRWTGNENQKPCRNYSMAQSQTKRLHPAIAWFNKLVQEFLSENWTELTAEEVSGKWVQETISSLVDASKLNQPVPKQKGKLQQCVDEIDLGTKLEKLQKMETKLMVCCDSFGAPGIETGMVYEVTVSGKFVKVSGIDGEFFANRFEDAEQNG
jgi:hypothetical protein